MKASEVYRMAAELVEKDMQFSCCAVDVACSHKGVLDWSPLTNKYRRVFGDDNGHLSIIPFNCDDDPKGLRILALCFMAAIAEDEERAARKRRN